jgi:aryl-alcohol dehydrogenase-like predicted oxidoreductase
VERVKPVVPSGMDLPELALRFILANPTVSTVIPGMRKVRHVERNLGASDGRGLPAATVAALRAHRWERSMEIP